MYDFLIDSYHALAIILNHHDQSELSSLKDFFKNPYTFSCFCYPTVINILSAIDLVFLIFGHFFYIRTFWPSARSFSHPIYIARGIIKQIARTTSFLEERLNFKIK